MLPYFKIFHETIYSYPLLMGIAWGAALNFFLFLLHKFNIQFFRPKMFFFGIFIFAWIGAKIFFITTSQGLVNKDFVSSSNFWLGGGFVFYGGLVFGLIYLLIYQIIYKNTYKSYSALIPPLALGHGIGRIGCYLAGCCYGSIINKSDPISNMSRYPVQLFEAGSLFLIAFISYYLLKHKKDVIGFYLIAYGIVRFILEFYRGDEIRGFWFLGLSTSQIISIFMILLALSIYIYRYVARRNSK